MARKPKQPLRPTRRRGPPEPPPLVIDTPDPLGAFDKLLKADPAKAKAEAEKMGKRPSRGA